MTKDEKAKHPGGRPTKLTPDVRELIVALVRKGNYMETAAASAGVSKECFYNWMRRGKSAKAGIYKEFSDAVLQAEAQAEAILLTELEKDGKGDWKSTAWRLERRFPKRWGRKIEAEVTGKDGEPLVKQDPVAELKDVLEGIAAKQAGTPESLASGVVVADVVVGDGGADGSGSGKHGGDGSPE